MNLDIPIEESGLSFCKTSKLRINAKGIASEKYQNNYNCYLDGKMRESIIYA
jgi:hypothetical protein